MSVEYLQSPPGMSYAYHKALESFFLQDRDDAFVFRVRSSENISIIMAYFKKPNGQEEFIGKFSPHDVDVFVSKRNKIYERYGRKPQPRVFQGGESL